MKAPTASYRVQLSADFDFAELGKRLGYLSRLGVSHLYASPVFTARPGSSHGYDVCDHNEISPELGGREGFEALTRKRSKAGLGWIQDIVPNHMAVSGANRMLVDVLENGPASRYFPFFDVDWDHPIESLRGRLLAPFLGDLFIHVLERGELRVGLDDDGFHVSYYELRFPLALATYPDVLNLGIRGLRETLGPQHPDYVKLLGIIYSVKALGEAMESEAEAERGGEGPAPVNLEERYEHIYFIKRLLWEVYTESEAIRQHVDANLAAINNTVEQDAKGAARGRRPYALLARLLEKQYFRLSYWKVASEEINYRRFFSINDLISLRMEDEDAFRHTHQEVLGLYQTGLIDGFRVDHVDGLYDPTGYLKRLRDNAPEALVYVEKILCQDVEADELGESPDLEDEQLPGFWPVQGSTGYDFLNAVTQFLCDPAARTELDAGYRDFTGESRSLEALSAVAKKRIIRRHMNGDVDNLARHVNAVASRDLRGFDMTMSATREAIAEVLARFPVYRTYLSHDAFRPSDFPYVQLAIDRARRAKPDLNLEFDFLERFLMLRQDEHVAEETRREWIHFVMRFQQYTGPLMAKGHEDTLLYIYNRTLCHNEVGGSPGRFARSPEHFLGFLRERSRNWPLAMNATATHDTKRGEDARARLAALTQMPGRFLDALKAFHQALPPEDHGGEAVDAPAVYLVFQALVGHWPLGTPEEARARAKKEDFGPRFAAYLEKALREAKEKTGWLTPDPAYEEAVQTYAADALKALAKGKGPACEAFEGLMRPLGDAGVTASLTQKALQCAAPGVPDLYQGCELWDFSFVDPDNRRPVPYARLAKMLGELEELGQGAGGAEELEEALRAMLAAPEDGRLKLFTVHRLLRARGAHPELFARGEAFTVAAEGTRASCAMGLGRRREAEAALLVFSRHTAPLLGEARYPTGSFWGDTRLAEWPGAETPSRWRDAFTGRVFEGGKALYLSKVLRHFPLALLVAEEGA